MDQPKHSLYIELYTWFLFARKENGPSERQQQNDK